MHELSDEEFAEYESLKAHYQKDLRRQSQESVGLEQDIDEPIRKCVMALALLGCEPQWSCCGFDYVGQPIHKWHMYGEVYILMTYIPASKKLVNRFLAQGKGLWECAVVKDGIPMIYLRAPLTQRQEWQHKDCPHFAEPAARNIAHLEEFLFSLADDFAEEAVIRDTNIRYHDHYEQWQYPTKDDWVVRRSDLISDAPAGDGGEATADSPSSAAGPESRAAGEEGSGSGHQVA